MKPISNPQHEAKESPAEERTEHRTGRELHPPRGKAMAKHGMHKGGKMTHMGKGAKPAMVKTPMAAGKAAPHK